MLRCGSRARAAVAAAAAYIFVLWPFETAAQAQFPPDSAGALVARALERTGDSVRVGQSGEGGWSWQEYELFDDEVPLTIDIVQNARVPVGKVIYFLAGGGTNFRSSFFTPREHNLAHFLSGLGYLVIGITPREHNLPIALTDYEFTAAWGMDHRREDVRTIVELVQAAVPLPYEVLGHSYGASAALDYASKYPLEVERVIALDIYSIDPQVDPLGVVAAESTYLAHVELLRQGTYVDGGGAGANVFATLPREVLLQDSGVSREPYGSPGNFTYEGLFFFTMIETALLPGIHTEQTGLSSDWPLGSSMFVGTYAMAPNPRDDLYALVHMDRTTVETAAATAGSGVWPVAFARDYWAVNSGNGTYTIDWSAIRNKLVWINAELGYGSQHYGANLVALSGNQNVNVHVVPGYGHGDVLLSRNAERDVWEKLR